MTNTKLKIITQEELDKVLSDHKTWLDSDGDKGTRADLSYSILSYSNLSYSNLSRSDLTGANLTNVNLTGANTSTIIGKRIITFQGNKHFAYYVDGYIKIGCEYHTLDYWIKNYERIGTEAEYSSEDIESYGNWIKSIKTED